MKAQENQGQQLHSNQSPKDLSWNFWPLVPLYPYGKRKTLRQEVVKDSIWTFDQIQGIFYVVVPIRMSVVKLKTGGLLVYAPVAPTPECIRMMRELETEHGEVQYIILPTISGIEHKVFVGPFARYFPQAQVFVAPSQWSFPLNLPLTWLGLPLRRTRILPFKSSEVPFSDQFDYAILGPIPLGLGKFAEVALLDKRTQTLLLTDSVISVPETPPEIVQQDPYPLLFHAKENGLEIVLDNDANRRKGWQRICLFSLYFQPNALQNRAWGEVWKEARNAPERTRKAYFGLFPFKWNKGWKESFYALVEGKKLLVAPILQTLILNRAPKETLEWANKVASWGFKRIIPCHFDSPIEATPAQFREAFCFLEPKTWVGTGLGENSSMSLPEEDLALMKQLNEGLVEIGVVPPAKGL